MNEDNIDGYEPEDLPEEVTEEEGSAPVAVAAPFLEDVSANESGIRLAVLEDHSDSSDRVVFAPSALEDPTANQSGIRF